MSKRNWVCFDCRSVVRREDYRAEVVVCATCSQPRVNIGYKIPIPKKSRGKEWEVLRAQHLSEQRAIALRHRREQARHRHSLGQEIERLELLPPNQGRRKAIRLLRKQLG
jgi:hypothetical protein